MVISKDEVVKRIRAFRGPQPNDPKGLPSNKDNSEGNEQIPGVFNQMGLADPGYVNFISGTGFGREMW